MSGFVNQQFAIILRGRHIRIGILPDIHQVSRIHHTPDQRQTRSNTKSQNGTNRR